MVFLDISCDDGRKYELRRIFHALHAPVLIRLPVIYSRVDVDEWLDFGLKTFANDAFFASMDRLSISFEPSLLAGRDELGRNSLYFCLREYRDVLRVHADHEWLLGAELLKAAGDPEYKLPPMESLYDFPELNTFAAVAACLTWNFGTGNVCHYTNTWHSSIPKRRQIWWRSEVQHRYETERLWRLKGPDSEWQHVPPKGWGGRDGYFRHRAGNRRLQGVDKHLSLQQAEALCTALEEYASQCEDHVWRDGDRDDSDSDRVEDREQDNEEEHEEEEEEEYDDEEEDEEYDEEEEEAEE